MTTVVKYSDRCSFDNAVSYHFNAMKINIQYDTFMLMVRLDETIIICCACNIN